MKHRFTLVLWGVGIFLTLTTHAQNRYNLEGRVVGVGGDPLPYASISINNAQYGTITNTAGEYKIKVPEGTYTLRITYLGYRPLTEKILLNSDLVKNFTLESEELFLEDVIITSDGRDPAYAIMQKAIDSKDLNEYPFPLYQYIAYTKSAFKFKDGFDPDSLMLLGPFGQKNPSEDEEVENAPAELKSELLYLSENMSEVTVMPPNKIKENIVKSKVSGESDQFSILGNLFNRFNPYENRTAMGSFSERGIISPMSDNAFFFYQFKLLGTLQNKEGKSYKIQVIPKREYDPVYSGIIYIADSSYAVKEIDWMITKTQQIQIIDTLSIRQTYQRIAGKWLPIQSRIGFSVDFAVFGLTIPIEGFTQSLLSEFDLQPDIDKKFFDREILAVSDSAMKQDSNFWESVRPVPLSEEELKDYTYKDSLEIVQNSPEYLDSLTKANRGVKPLDLLITGYSYTNYRKKTTWEIESMLETQGFNSMEGFFIAPSVSHNWDFEEHGSLEIKGRVRYGFSNEQLNGQVQVRWVNNPIRKEIWELSGGIYPSQFSSFSQIPPFANTLYTLFNHENFIRLYRSYFGRISFQREVLNGMTFSGNLINERRSQMVNTSEYSIFKKDKVYTPNFSFPEHNALVTSMTLSYIPFNRYISIPDGKINLGSAWPLLSLTFRKAFVLNEEETPDFSSLQLTLRQDLSLGLLGNMRWRVTGGTYLENTQTYFQDLFHFKGNEIIFRDGDYDEFWLMPYYLFSTTQNYLEVHAEHNFGGFVMNKLPLIRKLKLNEFLGFHFLKLDGSAYYSELNFGLEKLIFKVLPLRIDVNVRISGEPVGDKWGWKLVLP